MNKRIRRQGIEPRLLTLDELCGYLGYGKTLARRFAENCEALVRIGGTVRYDKARIDRALDTQNQQDT